MVSLSVVKDAGYFHSSIEHAVEYYSEKEGKVEGWWQGRLAEELGLVGKEVSREDVERVAGFIRNGERLGVDVTYSAPKSVSLVYSLLGDERVKEAHERAVRVANEWLEENLAWTRQGHGGKEKVPASGVAIVNYTHYTSRAHDPNLHTHSVVLNAVIRKTDGEIRALEPLQIFEYQRLVDQIYKNELARALQELGYSVEMKDSYGNFEIMGISKDVIDKFSERRNQIERAFAELKEKIEIRNEGAIKDMLAVKTREGKEVLSREELERLWDEKLRELGISREELRRAVEKAREEVVEVSKRDVKEFVREAANILHENESAFTKERLIEVALRLSLSQAGNGLQVVRVEDVERAIKDLRKEGYLVELNGYLATKEMVRVEREVIEYVQRTNGTVREIERDRVKIEGAIKKFEERVGYQLTEDQKKAVFHVLQSKDRVIGIQGDAGTGKTTVFQLVSGELKVRGFEMRGMAPTGKAADVLSREAGVRAQTVDSFLMEFERMKVVDNKAEYIRRYNEIKRKFEERSWWTPPRFLSGGIWDKIFGKKRETLVSQVKNWLRKELGIGKEGKRLNWFERKVSERCYVIEGNGFKGKMIVETVRTALGHYETYVWVMNEKTGDITMTRYAYLPTGTAVPISRKEKEEVWVNPDRVIEYGKEVWVIDESSMLDSKKMRAILAAAEKAGARVIVVGDVKQLKSVGAGQIFKDMQLNGMNTVVMSQKVRQKVEEYRQAVDALGKRDWEAFKERVDKNVREIRNREERLTAIRKDFLSGDYRKTLIVTARNADKNALNEQIRAELKAAGKLGNGYVFVVRESKNLSPEAKRYAFSYEVGDVVFIQRKDMKEMGIKSKGNEFKVVGVDITRNRIEIQDKAGKRFVVNVKEWGDRLSVYKEKRIEISKGEKVITLKNDKELGVKNGEMWVVEKISEDGTITIRNEDKVKTFNIKDYNYLDYGYAVTVHKSQGMTVNKVIFDVSAERTHFNEVYTALTRGKVEYSVYTNNKEVFYERMKHEQEKLSTIELSSAELRRAVGENLNALISSLKESASRVASSEQARFAGSGRSYSSIAVGHSEEQSRGYARGR